MLAGTRGRLPTRGIDVLSLFVQDSFARARDVASGANTSRAGGLGTLRGREGWEHIEGGSDTRMSRSSPAFWSPSTCNRLTRRAGNTSRAGLIPGCLG
eukprot:1192556-Prorocentrum_minimum.AAC.2